MFYSQQASGFSAILLFLLIAVGIVFPEMKADIALNRLIVMEEQTELSRELRQLLRGELRHFLKDPDIRDLLDEKAVHPESR